MPKAFTSTRRHHDTFRQPHDDRFPDTCEAPAVLLGVGQYVDDWRMPKEMSWAGPSSST